MAKRMHYFETVRRFSCYAIIRRGLNGVTICEMGQTFSHWTQELKKKTVKDHTHDHTHEEGKKKNNSTVRTFYF